jgi:uncharacterized protein YyaL (SSP411 family)
MCVILIVQKQKLCRTFKNGNAKIDGYLEDYSYLANALLDVFEISPNSKYLDLALELGTHLIDHFWDENANSFFMTSDTHESLIVRPKSNYDLSLPSGNSVSCMVMLRLFHLTQEQKFLEIATKIMESQAQMAAENPFGFGFLLNTIFMYLQKPLEITMLNDSNKEITTYLEKSFLPESIFLSINDSEQLENLSKYPFFAGKNFDSEKTTVFVCRDFTCSLPLEKLDDIKKAIE